MNRLVSFYLLLVFSVISIADEPGFQVEVLNVKYPEIEIQFVAAETGNAVHFKKALSSRGRIGINFWFENDQSSIEQFESILDVKQLLPLWNAQSQSLFLSYEVPSTTSSIGSHVGITVIAQKSKKQRMKWQHSEDYLSDIVSSAWISADRYIDLKQQIRKNQISDFTVSQVAKEIRERNHQQQCEVVLQADLNISRSEFSQCQVVANPVTGISMLDNRCKNLTLQWSDYLIAKSRNLCAIPAVLSDDIWPENRKIFNTALHTKLSSSSRGIFDVVSHDIDWMESQLEALSVSDDVMKSFLSYQKYSQSVLRQLTTSQKELDQLVSEKPFRDFLLSEMIRSIVAKQFKARNQFANWCRAQFESQEIADSCFQFAADISVRFFDIYGFSDLIEFNRSIETYRSNYTKWSNQNMGTKAGQRSKEYIMNWAVSFSDSLFEKPHCATETLFPFGNIMLDASDISHQPNFGPFIYPNVIEYKKHIDQLAKNKETFVQDIWQKLSEPGSRDNNPSSCVHELLNTESFSGILSRVEYFPYD